MLFTINPIDVIYIDNQNIHEVYLWKDGLHLLESGEIILANNFISFVSKYFFNSCMATREAHLNFAKQNDSSVDIVSKYSAAGHRKTAT